MSFFDSCQDISSVFVQTGPGFTLNEKKLEWLLDTFSLCLFDFYSGHFDEN